MKFPTRPFTRAEDEAILAQSRGEMSVNELERRIHRGHQTIKARAKLLGITLHKQDRHNYPDRQRPRSRRYNYIAKETPVWPEREVDAEANPCRAYRGEEDPLLARLLQVARAKLLADALDNS